MAALSYFDFAKLSKGLRLSGTPSALSRWSSSRAQIHARISWPCMTKSVPTPNNRYLSPPPVMAALRSSEGLPLFRTPSALSCSSSSSYSVRKSSSTRRSLNQNGRARGPIPCNSKARRRDVAFWAKAAAAERLAASSAALLCGFWSLLTLRINIIGNQILNAFHNPDTATPFHFNPAHVAVGAVALLLMTLVSTNGPKTGVPRNLLMFQFSVEMPLGPRTILETGMPPLIITLPMEFRKGKHCLRSVEMALGR